MGLQAKHSFMMSLFIMNLGFASAMRDITAEDVYKRQDVACFDALGELFDLVAEVVDIELTPHVRAGPVEHARERVAKHLSLIHI